jgi:hypothetical protein
LDDLGIYDGEASAKIDRSLTNWRKLEGNVERKRIQLLSMQPANFRINFALIPYQSPAQFVDMYLVELICNLLQQLTTQVKNTKTEAIKKIMQHRNKFPLNPDSGTDLQKDKLEEIKLLFNEVYPKKNFPVGSIGSGVTTTISSVNKELEQLKEQDDLDNRLKEIKQIIEGLPTDRNPYYCKVKLLGQETQNRLLEIGKELLWDRLRYLQFVQENRQKNKRVNSRQREDLDLYTIEYPGQKLQVNFYQYSSSTEPKTLSFSGPWACLRMLKESFDTRHKGYIKLEVDGKEDNLGGVLYLQLEFFTDRDCTDRIDQSFVEAITGF